MIRNTNIAIKDYENKELKDKDGNVVTFFSAITVALNDHSPETKPEEKAACFELCVKLFANKSADITVDQAALIKKAVGKCYSPLIYGRVTEFLDQKEEEGDK